MRTGGEAYLHRIDTLPLDKDAQAICGSFAVHPSVPETVQCLCHAIFVSGVKVQWAVPKRQFLAANHRPVMCMHAETTCLSLDALGLRG